MKNSIRTTIHRHQSILMSLIAVFLYSTIIVVAAPLYNPGDTLDPTCLPSATDCTVEIDRWSDYTTIPTDGLTNQVLTTDGAGVLSWTTPTASPISVANTTTLYSSGLSGTGSGSVTGYNIIFGVDAGASATSAHHSIFIGEDAGNGATNVTDAVFIGSGAGSSGATSAYSSNFIGVNAGQGAQFANSSNFFGTGAGFAATYASASNFFGPNAGSGASLGSNSNFFGTNAGSGATNAQNSIFIGKNAGLNDTVDNTVSGSSIAIGDGAGTGGFQNSIALGAGAINTAVNQFLVDDSYAYWSIRGVDYEMPSAVAAGNGYALTSTTGGVLSWAQVGGVGGSDTELQFNNAGNLDGIQYVTYDGTNLDARDTVFRLADNSDPTKRAIFEVSGIDTGTTRTYTFPNQAGTLALTSDLSNYTFSTGLTNTSGTITSNLSTGVSGGQSVVGGIASGNNLTLSSTSNATKGKIFFGSSGFNYFDEANTKVHLGSAIATAGGNGILNISKGLVITDFSSIATSIQGSLHLLNVNGSSPNNETTRAITWAANQNGTDYGTVGALLMSADYTNGSYFDFVTSNYWFGNMSSKMRINGFGNVGIGVLSPTARLHLTAGTTTASTAPLKFTSGALNTTPEAGAIEYDGTQLYFSPSNSDRNILLQNSTATAFTTGSIPFATTSGYLAEDNSNFFWDDTNNRLGISTTSPGAPLHLLGPNSGSTALGAVLMSRHWVSTTDTRASSMFHYFTGSSTNQGDMLAFGVSGDWTSVPQTYVTPNQTSAIKMVIGANGNVGIGTIAPAKTLTTYGASGSTIRAYDGTFNLDLAVNGYPTIQFGITSTAANSMLEIGSYSSINNIDTKGRDLKIFSTAGTSYLYMAQATGNIGIGTASPSYVLDTGTSNAVRVGGATITPQFGGVSYNNQAAFLFSTSGGNANTGRIWGQSGVSNLSFGQYSGTDNAIAFAADFAGMTAGNARADTTSANVIRANAGSLIFSADTGLAGGAGTFTYTERMRLTPAGLSVKTGAAPTAYLHLGAGTATASTAPLKFTSGTNLTTAEAGAMEYNGSSLLFTNNTTNGRSGILMTDSLGNTYTQNAKGATAFSSANVHNILIGSEAGAAMTGSYPQYAIALGYRALNKMIGSSNTISNIAIGKDAGMELLSGNANILIGNNAGIRDGFGSGITNASNNVALGNNTIVYTSGGYNLALGHSALQYIGSGNYNIGIGYEAGKMNSGLTGDQNVAIGRFTNFPSTSASGQLNIQNAIYGLSNTATDTTISSGGIGFYVQTPTARVHLPAGTITASTAPLKFDSGTITTTPEAGTVEYNGNFWFSKGTTAQSRGTPLLTNSYKSAYGYLAGSSLTTGQHNFYVGEGAGGTNATGEYNIGLGFESAFANGGSVSHNVGIGYYAMRKLTAANGYNVAIGYRPGYEITSGQYNTTIGYNAGDNITTGSNNVIIGKDIDAQSATTDNQLSIQNIIFGTGNSGTGTTVSTGKIGIGIAAPAYKFDVLGDVATDYVANFMNDGNNENRYGIQIQGGADDASGTTYYINALDGDGGQVGYIANTAGTFALTDVSDERTKTNIIDTEITGLQTIADLRVVDFNRIQNPDGPRITGFIAQEVETVYPKAVTTGANGFLGVTKDAFIPVLVKAIQELRIEVLELADLSNENSSLAESLRVFFGNATNRVTRIFTGEICLYEEGYSSECINRDELRQLKTLIGVTSSGGDTPPETPESETPPEEGTEDESTTDEIPSTDEETPSTETDATNTGSDVESTPDGGSDTSSGSSETL